MEINIVSYGIARDIVGESEMTLSLGKGLTIGGLKSQLIESYPAFDTLSSLRFAVNEDYQDDGYVLSENDEVVIIPPVSGG